MNNNLSEDFIFDKETVTITKYVGNSEECNVPNRINNVEVKFIGEKAFANCEHIVAVKIPNSIIDIGGYAFSKCESLSHVELPSSMKIIKRGVFAWCKSLKYITIPSSVSIICEMAFAKSGLIQLHIPSTVTKIETLAFSGNKNIVIVCDADSLAHSYAKKKVLRYKILGSEEIIVSNQKQANSKIESRLIDSKYKVTLVNNKVEQVSLDGEYEFININTYNTLEMNYVENLALVDYLYDFGDQVGSVENLIMTNCSQDVIHKTLSCNYLYKTRKIEITSNTSLKSLPNSICEYSSLEWLVLTRNGLTTLPKNIGMLHNLRFLDISQNAIPKLPETLIKLEFLENLDASFNYLNELPLDFSKLSSLKEIYLSYNEFKSIPSELTKMELLKLIRLDKNKIPDITER